MDFREPKVVTSRPSRMPPGNMPSSVKKAPEHAEAGDAPAKAKNAPEGAKNGSKGDAKKPLKKLGGVKPADDDAVAQKSKKFRDDAEAEKSPKKKGGLRPPEKKGEGIPKKAKAANPEEYDLENSPEEKPAKKNGDKSAKAKGEGKPAKKEKKARVPGTTGMAGTILKIITKGKLRSEKNAVSRGDLFDGVKKEHPDIEERNIETWINYAPGYLRQAGHTVESSGRGADRVYWGEMSTHEPFGRFKVKKPAKSK